MGDISISSIATWIETKILISSSDLATMSYLPGHLNLRKKGGGLQLGSNLQSETWVSKQAQVH